MLTHPALETLKKLMTKPGIFSSKSKAALARLIDFKNEPDINSSESKAATFASLPLFTSCLMCQNPAVPLPPSSESHQTVPLLSLQGQDICLHSMLLGNRVTIVKQESGLISQALVSALLEAEQQLDSLIQASDVATLKLKAGARQLQHPPEPQLASIIQTPSPGQLQPLQLPPDPRLSSIPQDPARESTRTLEPPPTLELPPTLEASIQAACNHREFATQPKAEQTVMKESDLAEAERTSLCVLDTDRLKGDHSCSRVDGVYKANQASLQQTPSGQFKVVLLADEDTSTKVIARIVKVIAKIVKVIAKIVKIVVRNPGESDSVSHVTCHVSIVIIFKCVGVSRWMVCYQWGLPRLVCTPVNLYPKVF